MRDSLQTVNEKNIERLAVSGNITIGNGNIVNSCSI